MENHFLLTIDRNYHSRKYLILFFFLFYPIMSDNK